MPPLSPTQWFLLPFFAHFAMVVGLYCWLTIERVGAVIRRQTQFSDYVGLGGDPERAMRVSRNLSNQFELPIWGLFAALFLFSQNAIGPIDIGLAWLFLGGRILHTLVQTLTRNVPLRGVVFALNFVAVMGLMARAACVMFC